MPIVDLFDDPNPIVKRAIELMGGVDAVTNSLEAEYVAMKLRWNQDITAIGRILRAHLYVEHYLTEHLQQVNPRLGDLDDARLTFAQKVNLLDGSWNIAIRQLIPGIKQLNKIRNRLAHNLTAAVSDEDAVIFLNVPIFSALRQADGKPREEGGKESPLDILEYFSEFAASCLHNSSSSFGKAYERAIKELT
ncbi:hypothetical protein C5615_36350 [Burkholderia cepacia]|uniref:Uncharacterized protein n=1 Tax=Burkholderia cepacia TaxID=292 RepID=A0A2S8I1E9_BURCE|nr:hypothetical protein [Burkholderia cepacia]PQP08515.1 hypothetical protein C5615_36350 [Burkholderia cepacia]HDR9511800.1 hypothetical protein [Burkholderia cepacia]